MSRFFDGQFSAECITFSAGNATFDQGPITMAALVKRNTTGTGTLYVVTGQNAGTDVWTVVVDAGSAFMCNDFGTGVATPAVSNWFWLVGTKASGSALPRWHIKNVTAGTAWSHANGSANVADNTGPVNGILVGNSTAAGTSDWRGWMATIAVFSTALSDAAIEAACTLSAADLLAAGPSWMVRFNQASTATSVTDDTGGGGNQTALSGTSVDAGDEPPGWSYALAGATAGPWRGPVPGRISPTGQLTQARPGPARPAPAALLGIAEETGTALAVTASHSLTLGIASETDTAVALGAEVARPYAGPWTAPTPGRASPTGQLRAQTPGPAKPAPAALLSAAEETDTALALTALKARTLGIASETDTALPVVGSKALAIGIAGESDTALTVASTTVQPYAGPWLAPTPGRLSPTGRLSAAPLGIATPAVPQSAAIGIAGETDTAQPVTYVPAVRHNLCPNPACGTDTTGWSGTVAPTRVTDVAGLPVTTGVRWTSSGFVQTPTGVVSPGQVVTASFYLGNNSGLDANSKTVYLAFDLSVGGDDFSNTTTVSFPAGTVTRGSITATAPANTVGCYLIIDAINGTLGTGMDISAVLYETGSSLNSYFDGDTSGARWDGTADNSTSTLGPQSAAVGIASETDSAQPITGALVLPLYAGPWRDVTPGWQSPTGQLMPQPLSMAAPTPAGLVGIASETDTALAVTALKTLASGIAGETDTALALSRLKTLAIGIASETDTAQPVTGALTAQVYAAPWRDRTPGRVSPTGYRTPQPFGPATAAGLLGIASEADSAQGLTALKARTLGIAGSTDTALSLSRLKVRTLGIASATDTALSVGTLATVVPPSTTTAASSGSWLTLMSILAEARQFFQEDVRATPVACPNDGEPLRTGPDGQLYCPYDGWRPPGVA